MSTTNQKPEQLSAEAVERMKLATAGSAQVEAAPVAPMVPKAVITAQEAEDLEETIKRILAERAPKPQVAKEPDWSKISETEALDLNAPVYIPVIEHDVPIYMDLKLKDPEYEGVWVNKNQIRVAAKQAEGYEFIKPEHFASDFKVPLKFNSEGLYIYEDVVAMRVHKRILWGRRRKEIERSTNQLKDDKAKELAKSRLQNTAIDTDPALSMAFQAGKMSFYN